MMLHEMKWVRQAGRFFLADLGDVRVWAAPDFSDYDIDISNPSEPYEYGVNYWRCLPAIQAQAVLHHVLHQRVTRRGNRGAAS